MELRGVVRSGARGGGVRVLRQGLIAILLAVSPASAQDATIRAAVDGISEERIAESLEWLVNVFGVRDAAREGSSRGIERAREWIVDEFESYSPRLQVRVSEWMFSGRPVYNVIAVLPGVRAPERQVVVGAHYDSPKGPGAADNASGIAAMLEAARVLSQHKFDKTLVFIAFSAEENGLIGSRMEAAAAKQRGDQIEAVLNADIVGNDPAPPDTRPQLDVYSGAANDLASSRLGRYIKVQAEAYNSVDIKMIQERDRVGHNSDHESYQGQGYAAVRLITPYESRDEHHTPLDTLSRASVPNTALAARVIASVAGSIALDIGTTALLPTPATTVPIP